MCNKYKNKKIFICRVGGMDNEYFILAKDNKEAKKILVEHLRKRFGTCLPPHIVPYDEHDIYCVDPESVKEDMIKENNEILLL